MSAGALKKKSRTEKSKLYILLAFLVISDHGRARTLNPQSRNLIFYPIELRGHYLFTP